MAKLAIGSRGASTSMQLREDDRNQVERSIGFQQELHAKVRKSRRFRQDEKAALQLDSITAAEAYFQQHFGNTLTAKSRFDMQHSHGTGLVAQNVNDAAASVHDALQALSPIIDAVKESGFPYAGIAVGTITFVFAASKHRQEREKRINVMLLAIQDRLLGLKLYSHIYTESHGLDQQLQSKISIAYHTFVSFCTAVVEYYELGGFVRWLISLSRATGLEDKAASVQGAIGAVRQVGEELLHKSAAEIKKKLQSVEQMNKSQLAEISELKQRIQDLQQSQDSQDLENVRQALGLDSTFSLEAELQRLEKRRGSVTAQFRRTYSFGPNVADRLAEVEAGPAFSSWLDSPRSRVLVLAGRNQVHEAAHCWLSPIAIELVKKLRKASTPELFAFFMIGEREAEDTLEHTLSTVAYRLLSQHRGVLRNKAAYDRLWTALQDYRNMKADESDRKHEVHRALRNVVLAVLNLFEPGQTVWIILDRLDQCQCATESRNFHRKAVLKSLVSLAEDRELGVKLRVLVVVNSLDWNVEEQKDEFGQTDDGSLVIRTLSQTK
ncbi:uncharacterized protein PG986_008693 [Apiospora aurea]|uniref:Fungal STAND N-terminal Goodbye domain-containing protein n=1 Tax=Apiospora aurea TaxID=335848 RepID=A0ABR1Q5G7_9PEZI